MATTAIRRVTDGVGEAMATQGLRRMVAGLVLAAAPMVYAVPAGATQYSAVFFSMVTMDYYWNLLLSASLNVSCAFIPLAGPVCIPLVAL
jgi:hypothetical protein